MPRSTLHGSPCSPMCRCGSTHTVRVGYSEDASLNSDTTALQRQCLDCGETYSYRVINGHLIPFASETAIALDEERAEKQRPAWSLERMTSFLRRAGVALEGGAR